MVEGGAIMSVCQEINSIFALMDAVIMKVNTEYNICEYAYYKGNLLCENKPYEFMLGKCSEIFSVKFAELHNKEIKAWLDNDLVEEYVASLNDKNGNKKTIAANKVKLDNHHFMVIVENLENKRYLFELIDPLTNLYQKAAFDKYVNSSIKEGKPFTLCALDIDNFKSINDTYGQMVGYQVLEGVAEILRKNLTNGLVARFGSDDFVFAYYGSTDYQDVWNLLYKITHEINDIGSRFDMPLDITSTIGVSRYGIDGTDYNELLQNADRALYRGKRKGKNCFIIYDPEKHKNISLDGVRKTAIEENGGNFNVFRTLVYIFDVLNSPKESQEILDGITELLVNIFDVDRAVIYHEDANHREKPISSAFKEMSKADNMPLTPILSDSWEKHYNNGICVFQNVRNIKDVNPNLYDEVSKQGIESIMRVPVEYKKTRIGALELSTFTHHDWSVSEKNLLVLVGGLLSVALYKIHENVYMEHQASTDELTGLVNYSRFRDLATARLNKSNKKMIGYSWNFERFKNINDKLGFRAGNEILKKFANILRKTFNNGIVSRVSSDRFVVLDYYDTDFDIKNKFDSVMWEVVKLEVDGERVNNLITLSCGVYVTDGTENVISIIIDKANLARRSLGNIYKSEMAIFTDEMQEKLMKAQEIETHFIDALKNDEFKLYLQPKIDIETGKLIGAEALSRWYYKNEKILPPMEYIPRLESTGLIVELDLHMFEALCKNIRLSYDSKFVGHVPVSINLSRNQKDFEGYINKLESIRQKYDIPPNLIEIEITESTFTENVAEIKKLINYIHKFGYRVAMDDFGSGYSNLSALVECGFDIIKLDKSLCADNASDKRSYILEAVINMCNKIGMKVICEGVETKEQAANLLRLGCRSAQGYLYDKPLPVNEFVNKYMEEEK